jgi:hypothetical protein
MMCLDVSNSKSYLPFKTKIMKSIFILFFLQLSLFVCYSQDCRSLPSKFNSYEQAKSKVKHTHFKYSDRINTTKSSWIRGASYYSCDGLSGYLIIQTNRNDYIHQGVPIKIWSEFKNAASFGSFYNSQIKNRYKLQLK